MDQGLSREKVKRPSLKEKKIEEGRKREETGEKGRDNTTQTWSGRPIVGKRKKGNT